jgi:hypothetical protein
MSTISRPNGVSETGISLKFARPRGMPMIVRHMSTKGDTRARDPERDRDDQNEHDERHDGVGECQDETAEHEPDEIEQDPHDSDCSAGARCAVRSASGLTLVPFLGRRQSV